MERTTIEIRVLKRCVTLVGSERALANMLRVPIVDLFLWLSGVERPTRQQFLAAVDILIERRDESGLEDLHSLSPDHLDGLDDLFGARQDSDLRRSST